MLLLELRHLLVKATAMRAWQTVLLYLMFVAGELLCWEALQITETLLRTYGNERVLIQECVPLQQ